MDSKSSFVFGRKQMNDILLQIMEWFVYHLIEIILLILCIVGWRLWWEIS